MLENLLDMNNVQAETGKAPGAETLSATIRIATDADREAIRQLVNHAFEVERFLKKGGGDRLQNESALISGCSPSRPRARAPAWDVS
jgi:hypothetical protein